MHTFFTKYLIGNKIMKKLLAYFLPLLLANTVHAFNNSYPTLAIVEYTSNCMAINYSSVSALKSCACSIDVIAAEIPYKKYVELETISRMQQIPGEKTLIFKTAAYRKKQGAFYKALLYMKKETI
jgi:hypothetical protein